MKEDTTKKQTDFGDGYTLLEWETPRKEQKKGLIVAKKGAKAYHDGRLIARFEGVHARLQAFTVIELHRAGAREASEARCAADIGAQITSEKYLKEHPLLELA